MTLFHIKTTMKFEWNENNRLINLQRHGFDFVGVSKAFDDPNALTVLDDRFNYGEIRFITFGSLNGRIVSVVHTESDEIIRIISLTLRSKLNRVQLPQS